MTILAIVMMIIFSSCVSNQINSKNYQEIAEKKQDKAFVAFQSKFLNNNLPASGWKIQVIVSKKGKDGFITGFHEALKHNYFYQLKPGKYEVKRFEFVSLDGNTRIGVLNVNQVLNLKPGSIHYLGNLQMQKVSFSTNAGKNVMTPLTYLQGGMEKQQLSKKLAAGWSFHWINEAALALSNIKAQFPELAELKWTNIILDSLDKSTN